MKCPICKSEMEKGYLQGAGWSKRKWDPVIGKIKTILAWKCQKCGKVELQADTKNE